MTMTNQEQFAERLARVQSGGAHTKGTIFIGLDEQHTPVRKGSVARSKGADLASNALYPASLVGAFLLGFVAVAFSRYAVFHLGSGSSDQPGSEFEMILSGIVGLTASFVLSQLFRLKSKLHMSMQSAGVFMMLCTFHNLIHWLPDLSGGLFSPAYVGQVIATSPANSVRLGQTYYEITSETGVLATGWTDPSALTAEGAQGCPAAAPGGPVKAAVSILTTENAGKSAKSGHKMVSVQEAPWQNAAAGEANACPEGLKIDQTN